MADDHDDHMPIFGGIPLPEEMAKELKERHDRAHMAQDALMSRVNAFLDNLDVEQCLAMRAILNADDDSKQNNFFDGQVYARLRYVHQVDPHTGEDPLKALQE